MEVFGDFIRPVQSPDENWDTLMCLNIQSNRMNS